MPTYSYRGPHDTEPHLVVAESFEREGETVTFLKVTSFDGAPRLSETLGVIVRGDVEVIDP